MQAHSFELAEPLAEAGEGGYKRGGLVTQVKEAKQLRFRPLSQVLPPARPLCLTDLILRTCVQRKSYMM